MLSVLGTDDILCIIKKILRDYLPKWVDNANNKLQLSLITLIEEKLKRKYQCLNITYD